MKAKSKQQSLGKHPLNPPQEGDLADIPLLRGTEGVSTLGNEGVSKSKSPLTSTERHPLNPPQEGDLTNLIPLKRGT